MRLDEEEGWVRLAGHDHGILCTVHPDRGVDAVPVVYAMDQDGYTGVPVDRVKPKAASRCVLVFRVLRITGWVAAP